MTIFFVDNVLLKMDIPKIPATFIGSGDLFAALFLAHLYLQSNMKITMEKTINSLYSVLLNTYEYSKGINNTYMRRHMYLSIIVIIYKQLLTVYADTEAESVKKMELQLIQSKKNIENPEIQLFAELL